MTDLWRHEWLRMRTQTIVVMTYGDRHGYPTVRPNAHILYRRVYDLQQRLLSERVRSLAHHSNRIL
jgi:hypothetical protein